MGIHHPYELNGQPDRQTTLQVYILAYCTIKCLWCHQKKFCGKLWISELKWEIWKKTFVKGIYMSLRIMPALNSWSFFFVSTRRRTIILLPVRCCSEQRDWDGASGASYIIVITFTAPSHKTKYNTLRQTRSKRPVGKYFFKFLFWEIFFLKIVVQYYPQTKTRAMRAREGLIKFFERISTHVWGLTEEKFSLMEAIFPIGWAYLSYTFLTKTNYFMLGVSLEKGRDRRRLASLEPYVYTFYACN